MTIQDAQDALVKDHLVLDTENITYTLTKDLKKGQIISSEPEAGSTIDKNSTVTISVSSGIGVEVEDYTGQNINTVEDALSQYTYLKSQCRFEEKSDKKSGTILRQEQLDSRTVI
jgi:beta-lactam-binding protein with PASTA domain